MTALGAWLAVAGFLFPALGWAGEPECATGLLVPAYFGESDALWRQLDELLKSSPDSPAAVIVNPASGPAAKRGTGLDVAGNQGFYNRYYTDRIAGLHVASSQKARTLGYVATGYMDYRTYLEGAAGYPKPHGFKEQVEADLGTDTGKKLIETVKQAEPKLDEDTVKLMAVLLLDVERWFQWYKGVDGIFFDEAVTSGRFDLYDFLGTYVKGKKAGAMVVYNPGASSGDPRQDAAHYAQADAVCVFESGGGGLDFLRGLSPSGNEKICVLLHGVAQAQTAQAALKASCEKKVGWFYVTKGGWSRLSPYFSRQNSKPALGTKTLPSIAVP